MKLHMSKKKADGRDFMVINMIVELPKDDEVEESERKVYFKRFKYGMLTVKQCFESHMLRGRGVERRVESSVEMIKNQ